MIKTVNEFKKNKNKSFNEQSIKFKYYKKYKFT